VADDRKTEQWGSRLGVILAVAGSAVGLGNFLRFPGLAAQNGGGAFMIPYFVAFLLLGIPLGWAEWTIGRYGGLRGFNSAPGIFSAIWPHPAAKYLGGIALIVPLVICMYYVVIEAWCLGYAWYYITGAFNKDTDGEFFSRFFDDFIGQNADGSLFRQSSPLLWFLAITVLTNFIVIYRGLSRGIEDFCKWAMPIMAICAVFVLVRVLTLGTPDLARPDRNLINGLGFMWNPNWGALLNAKTWLAAAGQIFFTLGVCFGIIINYSSYLKRKDDIVLSSLTASAVNEFFEVCLGGLITIPAAFMFFGALGESSQYSTFSLGFKVLPNVFAMMPAGQMFGFLWFVMLFLAAITSSLAMLQPVIAFFEEGLGLKRHASVTFLALLSSLGSAFVIYFSKGQVALDTFDFWGGTMLLLLLATIQAILYGWVLGIDRAQQAAHEGAHLRIPRFVQFIIKYISPLFLLAILIGNIFKFGPGYWSTLTSNPAAGISFGFMALIAAFFFVLVHIAGRRWKNERRLNVSNTPASNTDPLP
jgi:NSS family neurotransmitter:Na+ symporter